MNAQDFASRIQDSLYGRTLVVHGPDQRAYITNVSYDDPAEHRFPPCVTVNTTVDAAEALKSWTVGAFAFVLLHQVPNLEVVIWDNETGTRTPITDLVELRDDDEDEKGLCALLEGGEEDFKLSLDGDTYEVESGLGYINFTAYGEEDARKQHNDKFPEERIIDVRLVRVGPHDREVG